MSVTGHVWLELSRDERQVCLEFAAEQNGKRRMKSRLNVEDPCGVGAAKV